MNPWEILPGHCSGNIDLGSENLDCFLASELAIGLFCKLVFGRLLRGKLSC